MYDSMMIWTDDHLITRIVVQTFYEIINMMRLDNMGTEFFADLKLGFEPIILLYNPEPATSDKLKISCIFSI